MKLRVGDTPARDLERVAAVRKAFGDGLVILLDARAIAAGENHYTRFEFTSTPIPP